MADKHLVEYGGKRFPVPDGMTQEQVKAQMARFFPELAHPKIENKKDGEAIVWVFSKQAGIKGVTAEALSSLATSLSPGASPNRPSAAAPSCGWTCPRWTANRRSPSCWGRGRSIP